MSETCIYALRTMGSVGSFLRLPELVARFTKTIAAARPLPRYSEPAAFGRSTWSDFVHRAEVSRADLPGVIASW